MNRAVFLDRDGVVNQEVGYITELASLQLMPGAARAIQELREAGFMVVVVTNQSAIARGFLDEDGLERIHARLTSQLADAGTCLDGLYYCPHHPTAGDRVRYRRVCTCRKPAPGMLERASKELSLSLRDSYMVGDREIDVETGRNAGCQTIQIVGADDDRGLDSRADHVCDDLESATQWILERSSRSGTGP